MKLETLSGVAAESGLGRMSLDKIYHGDLEGTGRGEMLGFRSAVEGSGGYVAMEQFSGTFQGKEGGFLLQHSSQMSKGTVEQSIKIVPDSGTGGLIGISGTLLIRVEEGQHFYQLDYSGLD